MFIMFKNNKELIAYLKTEGLLPPKHKRIEEALLAFPREHFVVPEMLDMAYFDDVLPIGNGQTISQPYVVVFMLQLLAPKQGDNILEIGAGSGWQTALISYLVGKEGYVWAYEIRPDIAAFGRDNLASFHLANVDYIVGDASALWHEHAPYDGIIAGAAFTAIPDELRRLLKTGGRLVAPTQERDIRVIKRVGENKFVENIHPGFRFVPFV